MDNTETPSLKGFPNNINSKKEPKPVSANRNSDSITKVYFSHNPREVVSFRCQKELWEAFKLQTKQEGSSVCEVLEALIKAYLGMEKVNFSSKRKSPIVIKEFNLIREVKRPRRYPKVSEDDGMDGEVDFYDPKFGDWIKKPSSDGVNENGHGLGCGCLMCRNAKSL
jgi:hypothetical protein